MNNPRQTIVVLITDFYEGGPIERLYGVTKALVESGVTLLGLAALDEVAEPRYDRDTAERMVALGSCRRDDAGRTGGMGGAEDSLASLTAWRAGSVSDRSSADWSSPVAYAPGSPDC